MDINAILDPINGVIWHNYVLYIVLGVGVLFTLWSGFCQYRALTHGVQVTRGVYDDPSDPGAINHFQALSAALSATVGLGNIGGVAVAVALGGPGAVFWMWVIGVAGMALKTTEVCLSMLYRNTDEPDNPHGGPMWVADRGFSKWGLAGVGKVFGWIFCFTLLISAITGGNMFQAWNVGIVTENAFGIPTQATGIILCVVVGAVIIGGIKRIGAVAGRLVPLMCVLYLLAAGFILVQKIGIIPEMLGLIVKSAFNPLEAQGAFVGGTFGYALLWGMKRALFSSEAGQGSSPIAHSAAKTDEPVREAVVAGLEPFIDTIVVCTLTALVILSSGAWNRSSEASFDAFPGFVQTTDADDDPAWGLGVSSQDADGNTIWTTPLPPRSEDAKRVARADWTASGGEDVFLLARYGDDRQNTGTNISKVMGVTRVDDAGGLVVDWDLVAGAEPPQMMDDEERRGVFKEYPGAALTTYAFDRVTPGLGTYLVLLASWLFAISTMISWSYYGEQGIVYMFGERAVLLYKLVYCLLIVVSTLGFIRTDAELDNLTALGTGVMLWANIPIMLIFGTQAMAAYHSYFKRLKAGEMPMHAPASVTDVIGGKDVE